MPSRNLVHLDAVASELIIQPFIDAR